MDTQKIMAEARSILNNFGEQLKDVKISTKIDSDHSDKGIREEKEGLTCDDSFKAIMFKNAPKSDSECLILEKAAWN
ncbi:MAG: hypothetical protein ACP5NS_03365 [Candidatus Pacearchaeota archaeon]